MAEVVMLQVKEVWKLQEDKVVLVCDVFRDDIITNRIFTDVGEYEGSRFRVGIVKKCFSEPKTRDIILHTKEDCSIIRNIEFI